MQSPEHLAIWTRYPAKTPSFEGDRAALRGYSLGDVELIHAAARCADIPHVGSEVADGGKDSIVRYITANSARPVYKQGWSWIIVDKESGQPAGHIGVWLGNVVHGRAIIGYWVLPEFRRRGLTREALQLVTDFLDGLPGVTRIELHIETSNEASWRLAEKCGYTREAVMSRWQIIDGTPRDMYMYVVLPTIDYSLKAILNPLAADISNR